MIWCMCTLITWFPITSDERSTLVNTDCVCHLEQLRCQLASSTPSSHTRGLEACRSHRPVGQEASYSSVCTGQLSHFVKMSKTPMSQHIFHCHIYTRTIAIFLALDFFLFSIQTFTKIIMTASVSMSRSVHRCRKCWKAGWKFLVLCFRLDSNGDEAQVQ